ncbi:MAG: hypothetical protein AB1633_11115, partial [Elusimicrobiota bacterium]
MEENKLVNPKILFFTTDYLPLIGGIATYCYELANNLSKSHQLILLTSYYRGCKKFDTEQNFYTIRVINFPLVRELFFFITVIFLTATKKVNCILNGVWFPCGVLSYFAHIMFKIPYYISAHGSEIFDDNLSLKRRIKSKLIWIKKIV